MDSIVDLHLPTMRRTQSESSFCSDVSVGSCISYFSTVSILEPYVELEELQNTFRTFDKNGDGHISPEELRLTLSSLGFCLSEDELISIVKSVDKNGDGFVDFEEFISLYATLQGEEQVGAEMSATEQYKEVDADLKDAFRVFDLNDDGFISVQELQTVLINLGLQEGEKLLFCQDMIKGVDADGDGKVSFSEFKSMMCNQLSI